jgi:hypothetical protein
MDVMIVDDEPAARRTVRECCEREPDLRVIGEFGDPRSALAQPHGCALSRSHSSSCHGSNSVLKPGVVHHNHDSSSAK